MCEQVKVRRVLNSQINHEAVVADAATRRGSTSTVLAGIISSGYSVAAQNNEAAREGGTLCAVDVQDPRLLQGSAT